MLKYQRVNNEDIAYYETNQHLPNTLVLVHGNMSSWVSWKEVYPLLDQFHIISINLRGFGESSISQSLVVLEPFAQDIISLLEIKKISKVTLNGWSFGGLVILKVAELRPDLVDRIIMTNAVGHQGYHLKNSQGEYINEEDFLNSDKLKDYQAMMINKNKQLLTQVFELMLFTHCKDLPEHRKNELLEVAFLQRNTYKDTSQILVKSKVDISKIDAKWLIIVGANDKVVPFYIIEPTIQYLESNGKDVRVVKIQEGAHMAPIEIPERYAQLVTEFILGK